MFAGDKMQQSQIASRNEGNTKVIHPKSYQH
jgi:hypothetical protein